MPASRSRVVILSPASGGANNGNGSTAQRWQRFLVRRYAVTLAAEWHADPDAAVPDLLIALHARRSADALARFVEAHPSRPTILVLTGTDLYRDIAIDEVARDSLALATRLVVLQPEGVAALPPAMRDKTDVIMQSAPRLRRRAPDPRTFDLVMVGPMRGEKDPATAWRAFERVSRQDRSIRLIHIGDAVDETYRRQAEALAARNPGYRWLGVLSHALTRQQIRRARVLVIPSVMEGGAHSVIEAITCGVPVLASAIPGNVGLLGRHYAGTFPAGDNAALASLIDRVRREPAFLALLTQQCAERAPLFRPERERSQLIALVDSCLAPSALFPAPSS